MVFQLLFHFLICFVYKNNNIIIIVCLWNVSVVFLIRPVYHYYYEYIGICLYINNTCMLSSYERLLQDI